MAYTLQLRIATILDVVEIADDSTSPGSGDTGDRRTYDQYSVEQFLSGEAGSYPEVGGKVADLSYTLGGATQAVDLTALKWAGDVSTTFTALGKKLVGLLLRFSKGNNAAGVSFGGNGASAYGLFGTTTKPIFYPGTNLCLGVFDPLQAASFTNNLPAVAAGAKDLLFTGTAADVITGLAVFSE